LVTTLSCKTDAEKSYETKAKIDTNGFAYETVENDPTGLR
jgi:hypothetical protein